MLHAYIIKDNYVNRLVGICCSVENLAFMENYFLIRSAVEFLSDFTVVKGMNSLHTVHIIYCI